MTLTTHAAVGMIVAQWTDHILLGFCIALLSHYILDMIPHGDEWIYWRHVHNAKDRIAIMIAAADVIVLSVLMIVIVQRVPSSYAPYISAGAFGGILPDLLITLHTKTRHKFRDYYPGWFHKIQKFYHLLLQKHYTFHMAFHSAMHAPIRFRFAILYQLVFLTFFVRYFV